MGLNDTPKGDRVHIAIFGKRNAGKSSLINALTGQELAIVSDVRGTTTDPVYKAMELLPLGPVMMIDTPGLDDEGELGKLRIEKAVEVLQKTDIAILVTEAPEDQGSPEEDEIEKLIRRRKIPLAEVVNKADLISDETALNIKESGRLAVSTKTGRGIRELKEYLAALIPKEEGAYPIIKDLLEPDDLVVLVVPIDKAAPKGRLILPQQQTIRDILEADARAVVTKENGLKQTLSGLASKPKMVITDSQVFRKVSGDTPEDILLTSFSILFARHKGNLEELVRGVRAVEHLKDGDVILMAEGCTHHRQCDDIGTVKIPGWLLAYTGRRLIFETSSGGSYPKDLTRYALVVHCGGCTLNEKEMKYRIARAGRQEIPIVNYGILIAYMQGILERSLQPFPFISRILGES